MDTTSNLLNPNLSCFITSVPSVGIAVLLGGSFPSFSLAFLAFVNLTSCPSYSLSAFLIFNPVLNCS